MVWFMVDMPTSEIPLTPIQPLPAHLCPHFASYFYVLSPLPSSCFFHLKVLLDSIPFLPLSCLLCSLYFKLHFAHPFLLRSTPSSWYTRRRPISRFSFFILFSFSAQLSSYVS